jgi:hypothetical protein
MKLLGNLGLGQRARMIITIFCIGSGFAFHTWLREGLAFGNGRPLDDGVTKYSDGRILHN